MCHSRGVFDGHLDGIVKKPTAWVKLANKFNMMAKLAENLIQGGNFDNRNSSRGVFDSLPLCICNIIYIICFPPIIIIFSPYPEKKNSSLSVLIHPSSFSNLEARRTSNIQIY